MAVLPSDSLAARLAAEGGPTANDEPAAELLPPAPPAADDPCDEAGYDRRCRNPQGEKCRLHDDHCRAPEFRCRDLLRHQEALAFLEEEEVRRRDSHRLDDRSDG